MKFEELNEEQKGAVAHTERFFTERNDLAMTLIGPGGSGKTTCVFFSVERLVKAGLKVLLAAPTNKAVKQLEKSSREFGEIENTAFSTLHGALGLAILPNEENQSTVKVGKGLLELFDVIVVDECSMLGKFVLYKHLLPEAQDKGCRLLFMGDDFQLNPVMEDLSPTFTEFESIALERVERQGQDSEILEVNNALRTAIKSKKPFKAPDPQGRDIEMIKPGHFLNHLVESFDADTDLEQYRILSWSNKRVDEINAAIRKKIYGRNPDLFVAGERVVTGKPLKDMEGNVQLSTDEECWVYNVTESTVFDDHTGEDYKTFRLVLDPVYDEDSGKVIAQVLQPSERDRFYEQLDGMARAAKNSSPQDRRRMWASFWAFKELFADIRHCYCITVHRSQGSTFEHVYLDVKDILRNTKRFERQRLLYVGYSRPRTKLTVNKPKYAA